MFDGPKVIAKINCWVEEKRKKKKKKREEQFLDSCIAIVLLGLYGGVGLKKEKGRTIFRIGAYL